MHSDENKPLEALGVGITHHFAGGLYCKETRIPAGVKLTQHKHTFDHLSVLAKGRALVTVDGVSTEHAEGSFLTIAAGKVHEVTALTDAVWGCLHATDCTDPAKVDHQLVRP